MVKDNENKRVCSIGHIRAIAKVKNVINYAQQLLIYRQINITLF